MLLHVRIETTLAQDIVDADGTVFMESGTYIRRDERNALRKELSKGRLCYSLPVQSAVQSSGCRGSSDERAEQGLVGRVLGS